MQRNRILVLAALIMGVIFLFTQPAITAGAKEKAAAKTAKAKKAGKIGKTIGLTIEQNARIKAIKADAKTQVQAANADTSLTADAKKAKITAIRKAALEQIKQVLTPEQQKKLKKGKGEQDKNDKFAKLGLTADQKAKIKAIKENAKSQIAAVEADKTMTAEAKKAKIKEIRAATKANILQVLTPEQRKKMQHALGNKGKKKVKAT